MNTHDGEGEGERKYEWEEKKVILHKVLNIAFYGRFNALLDAILT